jgi:hypothetical protein
MIKLQKGDINVSKLDLTPEARLRLWKCYSLLLELAEEDEKNIGVYPEMDENEDVSMTPNDQSNSTLWKEIPMDEQEPALLEEELPGNQSDTPNKLQSQTSAAS